MSTSLDQLIYKQNGNGRTQCERILDALRFWPANEWCPMPHLARCASDTGDGAGLAVHSRIADLRRKLRPQGWTIQRDTKYLDGHVHSFYRLVRLAPAAQQPKQPTQGTPESHDNPA